MTKPNRLQAILNRPAHERDTVPAPASDERPTRPAPAFTACRAAVERERASYEREVDVRAALRTDPASQARLLALRDQVLGGTDVELEVDAYFADC